jgi:hypothetical protein
MPLASVSWPLPASSIHWTCLCILCVLALFPSCSLQGSTLGERDLSALSSAQISTLVSSPDPVRNINLANPNSHLSKILIPRVGMSMHQHYFLVNKYSI